MCFNNILFEHTETRMNKKIKNPETDHLFQAILTLKNLDECYAFFEDVCTVNELQSIAQRFEVAAMLRQKNTYLGDCTENRCIYCDNQPCEPKLKLWK